MTHYGNVPVSSLIHGLGEQGMQFEAFRKCWNRELLIEYKFHIFLCTFYMYDIMNICKFPPLVLVFLVSILLGVIYTKYECVI